MSTSSDRRSRTTGQSLTECLVMVAGVALFALMGFSAFNAGVGTQSAAMAGALAGGNARAEVAFTQSLESTGLVDFDATIPAAAADTGGSGLAAFTKGFATGVIENLIAEISALASPIETAVALAELGRLLATDTVATIDALYQELVVSQIDTLINGTDYERGRVLGNQVSALKALSVVAKASGATVLAGIARRADDDKPGSGTPIHGKGQETKKNGKSTTHASTSERKAREMAESGEYKDIYLNRSVGTITDGDKKSRVRPDTAGVRIDDGKVDVVEVLSPGQTEQEMIDKLTKALGDRCGTITCIPPDPE